MAPSSRMMRPDANGLWSRASVGSDHAGGARYRRRFVRERGYHSHARLRRQGENSRKVVRTHLVSALRPNVQAAAYRGEVAGPVARVEARAVPRLSFGAEVEERDDVRAANGNEQHIAL